MVSLVSKSFWLIEAGPHRGRVHVITTTPYGPEELVCDAPAEHHPQAPDAQDQPHPQCFVVWHDGPLCCLPAPYAVNPIRRGSVAFPLRAKTQHRAPALASMGTSRGRSSLAP